jgi:hypothetical protein
VSAPDDPDPAEARVSALLGDLRDATPQAPGLPASVGRSARWQAPVRRAVLRASTTAGGFADGIAALLRGRRSR